MAWALPEGAVLGIFGKRPEPGRVRARLAAALGAEAAVEMHEAMLFDLLDTRADERVLAPGGRRVRVFAPEDAGPRFDPRVPAAYALRPQAEGDPGLRIRAFSEGEFEDGATRVVLIGPDAPMLDPSIVISASLCLELRGVVLGPARRRARMRTHRGATGGPETERRLESPGVRPREEFAEASTVAVFGHHTTHDAAPPVRICGTGRTALPRHGRQPRPRTLLPPTDILLWGSLTATSMNFGPTQASGARSVISSPGRGPVTRSGSTCPSRAWG